MYKQLSAIDRRLRDCGFEVHSRSTKEVTWARQSTHVTREELTLQSSSPKEHAFVGVLRVSIRSHLWDGLRLTAEHGDAFAEALTVEWGSNGIFPYGWQSWTPWEAKHVDLIKASMDTQALPWLERHSDPKRLAVTLERETTQGVPLRAPSEPLQRTVVAAWLFGKDKSKSQDLFFPRGHKQRLAELYFELGDIDGAVTWAKRWLADMKGWNEAPRYEEHLQRILQAQQATR